MFWIAGLGILLLGWLIWSRWLCLGKERLLGCTWFVGFDILIVINEGIF